MELTTGETPVPDQPALIITRGVTSRKWRPLDHGVSVLGRGPRCNIRVDPPTASEPHCIIARTQEDYRIRNYAERATVVLNGKPIREALLHDGDSLEIASISFRVHLPETAAVTGQIVADPNRSHRLERSRRNLARLAL